jgi:L-ascorbate metabolism protein UlaG (beta-lactamase superfamily)
MAQAVEVWYLGHSGFAVKIADTIMIFDYYLDNPAGDKRALETGVVDPDEIKDKKVLIFSSHRHPDHFNPLILSWKEKLPQAEFFFSSDITKKHHREWTNILKPNQTYENEGLRIQTFKSTDAGVAFLVTINGIAVYHAGDLNWWHWDEESKAWNGDMEARFKHEVSLLKDFPVDIAFLTTDPRQESAELWGVSYILEHVNVGTAFPMHFGNDYSIMERIKTESSANSSLNKIKVISARGNHFVLSL